MTLLKVTPWIFAVLAVIEVVLSAIGREWETMIWALWTAYWAAQTGIMRNHDD